MKFMIQTFPLTACIALTFAASACTTVQGTTTHACDVTRVPLNTGYDHVKAEMIDLGESDAKWIVVRDPDPSTTEPRRATAVHHDGWAPAQPGTQWVGPLPEGTTTTPNAPGTPGDSVYSYLYCYCLCGDGASESAFLQGTLRADNEVTLYLNDTVILAQTPSDTWDDPTPMPFSAGNDQMRRGINCLRADVKNDTWGHNPTGLNIAGEVVKTSCCRGRTSRPAPGPGVGDPLAETARWEEAR